MRYIFQCESCENIEELDIDINEIQDIQTESNGKEKPKCPECENKMKRIYKFPHVRKYKGLITPSQLKTPDGKTHNLSPNLYRN